MEAVNYDRLLEQLEQQRYLLETHLSDVRDQIESVRRAAAASRGDGDDTHQTTSGTIGAEASASPSKKRRILPICTIEGCTNTVKKAGLCTKHGAERKFCSHEECTKHAQRRGLCQRHGAMDVCSLAGCMNKVRARGKCRKHGREEIARPICRHEGCTNQAQKAGGVCARHVPLLFR